MPIIYNNMTKQNNLSNFLSEVEEYEKVHALWCAKLVAHGRQTIQSISNKIDDEHLTNLVDSFMKFVSLLAQCNPNLLPDKKSLKPNESSKEQNESLSLIPKNVIIEMVNNDLLCPICNEWLLLATSANCNHTYCKKCIQKWLKINETCPVCRSSIQYISTSLAIDHFISNLCQLIGGFIKQQRQSIQNAQDHSEVQTSLNSSFDEINDLNITESIVEDTYYNSLLEITTPMPHPNMARLIPLQSNTLESRINLRQMVDGPGNVHPNRVELIPLTRSSISPRPNQVQPTNMPDLRQVFDSPRNVHPNRVELIPLPRSSIVSPHSNQVQPTYTSVASPQLNRFPFTSISTLNSHTNCVQLKPLTTSTVSPRVNCNQPSSSTSMVNRHVCNLQQKPSSFGNPKNDRIVTSTDSKSPLRNNSNKPNLLHQQQNKSLQGTKVKP